MLVEKEIVCPSTVYDEDPDHLLLLLQGLFHLHFDFYHR